jgi:Zn-dependent protease with chaperone function
LSAAKIYNHLLAVTLFTMIVFALAIVSPWLLGMVLSVEDGGEQNVFLACLFLPTLADWPAHLVSYALAVLLALGLLSGTSVFWSQWRKTRRLELLLRQTSAGGDLRMQLFENLALRQELARKVDVIRSDKPLAFCYGWLRPRICVSTGMATALGSDEFQALLLHEEHHLVRRDPMKTALSRVLARTFFFLPVIGALQQQYLLAKEIDADEYVLRTQGSSRPLVSALYTLLQGSNGEQPGRLAVVGADEALNQRLDYLLHGRTYTRLTGGVLFASSALIMGISTMIVIATWASAASTLWHQAHDGLGC